ncbi:MAG: FKBP-type peptidyl-prolyl cis-trans isomerase [Alphaproteobacteria bacterium]|nr:FKBP-type peptidyl-prolyl cis-trans isomerase [Alphaproteobacteria bacterium]MDA8030692.1 FKBP-type peptidyl-prolyl cis-trans isomerase [Alphaproteobacteria bacterium]
MTAAVMAAAMAAATVTAPSPARAELRDMGRGLLFEDVKIGEGPPAVHHSRIRVHYVGTLEDGTEFDSSVSRGEPFEFLLGVGSVIQGWEMGMLGMRAGGERVLVIPPELGYGDRAVGSIPAGSVLNFEVEVLEVLPPPYEARTVSELETLIDARGDNLTVVDIRRVESVRETGVIEGSTTIQILGPRGRAVPNLGQLLLEGVPQDVPVVVVDENGALAVELAYLMANNRWRDVSYLKGGVRAWRVSGRPLVAHSDN